MTSKTNSKSSGVTIQLTEQADRYSKTEILRANSLLMAGQQEQAYDVIQGLLNAKAITIKYVVKSNSS